MNALDLESESAGMSSRFTGLDEMDEDVLSVFDVERAILTGEIMERQRDQATREWKYLVRGTAVDGRQIVVVSKLGPTDKLVVITAWVSDEQAEM